MVLGLRPCFWAITVTCSSTLCTSLVGGSLLSKNRTASWSCSTCLLKSLRLAGGLLEIGQFGPLAFQSLLGLRQVAGWPA